MSVMTPQMSGNNVTERANAFNIFVPEAGNFLKCAPGGQFTGTRRELVENVLCGSLRFKDFSNQGDEFTDHLVKGMGPAFSPHGKATRFGLTATPIPTPAGADQRFSFRYVA
jgi:hypothetical protein